MKKVVILNEKNRVLFKNAAMTTHFFDRLIGLAGKSKIEEDQALCIKPCKSIHMLFMRFSIDVVFLDASGKVIGRIENLKPWRVSGYVKNSKTVIEMPCHSIKKKNIKLNDKIIILTTHLVSIQE